MLVEKRRVAVDLSTILADIKTRPGFKLRALVPEVVLRIQTLTTLRDIHDRLIVAEALQFDATLITRDRAIIASGLVPTLWH